MVDSSLQKPHSVTIVPAQQLEGQLSSKRDGDEPDSTVIEFGKLLGEVSINDSYEDTRCYYCSKVYKTQSARAKHVKKKHSSLH
jgi:hypothetical protein